MYNNKVSLKIKLRKLTPEATRKKKKIKTLKKLDSNGGDIWKHRRLMGVRCCVCDVSAEDVVEGEALRQTILSEMSKASYERQQKTSILTHL